MSFEIILDREESGTSVFMKDLNTGCQVSVLSFGAVLNGFAVPYQGEYINIMDSYLDNEDASQHIEDDFRGAKISPFTGKLKKGHFTFNSRDYKVEKFSEGSHASNGLMYDHKFEIASTKKTADKAELLLKGFYAGDDKGYPFKYLCDVTYRLEPQNKLTVETCVQHFHEHSIPYGEAWNNWFLLSTNGDDCTLQINAKEKVCVDKNFICVDETISDDQFFHSASLADKYFEEVYVLESGKPAAILRDDILELKIIANQGYPFLAAEKKSENASVKLACMSAVPDAFNHGKGLLILEPGKKYNFSCTYILNTI